MNWNVIPLLAALLCLPVTSLEAGAWPRGKGKTFAATSATLTWPDQRALELPDIYGSAYVEHGLSPRLTLGLDIGSPDATRPERLKTVGFLRYTLTANDAPYQMALDGGGGRFLDKNVIRFGISYGLGFSTLGKNAWVAVDAHALRAHTTAQTAFAIDATIGVSLKRGKIMGQFSAFQAFDKVQSISVTPAYAHDLGKGRHLEVGVVLGLRGKPDPALKIGIWQEF